MKFHPLKCKVVTIHISQSSFSPCDASLYPVHYLSHGNLLEFVNSETDLGVNINSDLNLNLQCESL